MAPTQRVALPQPLAPSEAARIRRIFALHAKHDIPAAVAESEQVVDGLLLPDILADRYLIGGSRPLTVDLTAWLAQYRDLPDAPFIHALLATQSPHIAAALPVPRPMPSLPAATAGDDVEPFEKLFARNLSLDRTIHDAARVDPDRALALIDAREV